MKRIAQFFKVSKEVFNSVCDKEVYEDIMLPARATAGSAGYDFFAPFDFELNPGESITIPTGIRAKIDEGFVLKIYPRSGLGFKYRLTLNNTVGIIDSDYFYAENQGHILIKMTNCGNDLLKIEKGRGFAQGIFLEYGITIDDNATSIRTGGFGSTDKK